MRAKYTLPILQLPKADWMGAQTTMHNIVRAQTTEAERDLIDREPEMMSYKQEQTVIPEAHRSKLQGMQTVKDKRDHSAH